MTNGNAHMPSIVALDPPSASKRARVFTILALAQLLLLPSLSLAAPITVPTSLLPGAQYRLAFVTEGVRDATSTSITDYDAFVTAEANTEAALSSITWQVIGSTFTVSARDHTSTAPDDYPGVPIFLLNGVKLVDDYADLWDGTIDVPLAVDQHGNVVPPRLVWTGTLPDGRSAGPQSDGFARAGELGGTCFFGQFIGNNCTVVGVAVADINPEDAWGSWIAHCGVGSCGWPNREPFVFYALSNILVVPEPTNTALLTLGFAALLLVRRVRLS